MTVPATPLPAASKDRLAKLLKERSYEDRKVTLASGRESDFYLDCKQTTLHPEGLYLVGRFFLDAVRSGPKPVRAVGGPTLGSDPIAAACAVVSWLDGAPMPAFIIRKEPKGHGTRAWVEGAKFLEYGTPIAIVEDVVTTGGSSLKAAGHAKEAGLDVVKIVALVDRDEGAAAAIRAAGYVFESILTIHEVRRAT